MSDCFERLQSAMTDAHVAAITLRAISPDDELIQPLTHTGVDIETWEDFQERFGDKSGNETDPMCVRAVFWENYRDAIDARISELVPGL